MRAIRTVESNFTFLGPTPEVADLPGRVEPKENRFWAIFAFTDEERTMIANGAQLKLGIWQLPMPPVSVSVLKVAEAAGVEKEGVPVEPDWRCRLCDNLYVNERAIAIGFVCGHCAGELHVVEPTPEPEPSEFATWAEAELRRAGLFDEDADYGPLLGESVMKLVAAFADEGHSGNSAAMASSIFARLSDWKPLTPLTNDPNEWMHIEEGMAGRPDCWQSRRSPSCFSHDGGLTYYDVDEDQPRWRRVAARVLRRRMEKKHVAGGVV